MTPFTIKAQVLFFSFLKCEVKSSTDNDAQDVNIGRNSKYHVDVVKFGTKSAVTTSQREQVSCL